MTERIGSWKEGVEVIEVSGPVHRVKFPGDDKPAGLWFCNACSGSFFQKCGDHLVCTCTKRGEGPLLVIPVEEAAGGT